MRTVLLNTAFCAFSILGVVIVFTGAALPSTPIAIRLLDGRSGKPMANERLLVFLGNSQGEVRKKTHMVSLQTDADGVALLPAAESSYSLIQVWVDTRTLCQETPNLKSYSLDEVKTNGASTPDNCGHIKPELTPNEFVIFARPATFWEKMRW